MTVVTEEHRRLLAAGREAVPWRKWGPYLSERQWGTVREDYSSNGDAWNYVTHDAARAVAYRWGEDGLAGVCDDGATLCFALALWNERDPIIKERLFGLTNGEGNHAEDVKEYYFYLDSTPTHSFMRWLYKYPQRPFPYQQLLDGNRQRTRNDPEYELCDTGIFDDGRYFDVEVTYAKAAPEDLLVEISVRNWGPVEARLRLLPTIWFRNTWTGTGGPRPRLWVEGTRDDALVIGADSPVLGRRFLYCQPEAELLFTDNETNRFRFPRAETDPEVSYYKDAFDWYVVHDNHDAVNPARQGTKAGAYYRLTIPADGIATVRLRLCEAPPEAISVAPLGGAFSEVLEARRREADEFFGQVIPSSLTPDQRHVVRQALAGMLWSKQFYLYDVTRWLAEHGVDPFQRGGPRNSDWKHMFNGDVISMPDKWEYPWYAAWDLAFHTVPLAMVDMDLAKEQLELLMQERYLHPNGQVPAYEWNFSDVNPPVHAWATFFLYQLEELQRGARGRGDLGFLRRMYEKLLLNFTWWVNRKDPDGRNVFEGGFLGLDNIGVFDRSAPLPTGGHLEQADGTAWMAFYSQVMLQMSIELTLDDPAYKGMAIKFFEHFIWIAAAMTHIGGGDMWDEEDGFFYDLLRAPDGSATPLKVRSMVGLLPVCAATVLPETALPELDQRASWFLQNRPQLVRNIHDPREPGVRGRHLLAILGGKRLRRVLARMLDEKEFLSPYGIRSLSAHHRDHPYVFNVRGDEYRVSYRPAESDSGMFGGNSNWRGPIWMPVNALLIRALVSYYAYYGDDFRVECPTGSGRMLTLYQVAQELTERLARIFTPDGEGHRPVYGGVRLFREDPSWRDIVLFYEFFHGDNGAGIGASHQTGWSGLIASLLAFFAQVSPADALAGQLPNAAPPRGSAASADRRRPE